MLKSLFPPLPSFGIASVTGGKALGTIKDKRWANVGAIKPAGVVNMVSSLQEDVDFGGLLPIGKNLHVSFLR